MSKLIFEAKRKFIHIIGISYIAIYWFLQRYISHEVAILTLTLSLIILICIEFFRVVEKRKIPVFHVLWRAKEENTIGGQVYYILGITLAFAIFDFKIALAVILMTIFGDTAAAIFGIAFGKHWIKKLEDTAWEGVIAEFVVDLIIGYAILGNFFIAIPMALMATVVETIFPHVDDNLTIPIFAGFIGQALKILFL